MKDLKALRYKSELYRSASVYSSGKLAFQSLSYIASFKKIVRGHLEIIISPTSVFWLQANNGRLRPIDQSAIPNIIRQRQLER